MSTFWFASRRVKLQKVVFGISFMEYNPYPRDRVTQAEEIARHPALYFLNSDVLETTAYDIADAIFRVTYQSVAAGEQRCILGEPIGVPQYAIQEKSSPQETLKTKFGRLSSIAMHIDISIIFVIPPQHIDAQRRVRELGVRG